MEYLLDFFLTVILLITIYLFLVARFWERSFFAERLKYINEYGEKITVIKKKEKKDNKEEIRQNIKNMLTKISPNIYQAWIEEKLYDAGLILKYSSTDIVYRQLLILLIGIGFMIIAILLETMSEIKLIIVLLQVVLLFWPILKIYEYKKRKISQIYRYWPDFIDILGITVQAGMGLDLAIKKITEKLPETNLLKNELEIYLRQLNMGLSKKVILTDMAKRLPFKEVEQFATAVIQSEQMGVSIASVLKEKSKEIKKKRELEAEEKANKLGTKLLIPVSLFIFPCIFIAIAGPLVVNLINN